MQQKTILVVEDYDDTREMIAQILRGKGFRVVEAADGLKAVNAAKQEKPDLILTDLSLPALDGFEATRRIKEEAGTKHIPVVAVSAHCGESGSREKAQSVGCLDCVNKPVDFAALDGILDRFMPGAS
jgi:two-component system cell cycle response regulator DivK